MSQFLVVWHAWLWPLVVVGAAVFLALVIHRFAAAILQRLTKRSGHALTFSLLRHGKAPTRLLLPLLAVAMVLPILPFSPDVIGLVRHVLALGMIAAFGWLLIATTSTVDELVARRYDVAVTDNLRARQIHTQSRVLRRVAHVAIVVLTISLMLTTFPGIRELGISLFASAGLAGLVVGMAARPTLASLLAGLQIALTEPIRIDDVVIVEGEWGWVEEIGPTFVVVRIWDLRRLVVPLTYFIEKPFQNWTRRTADILGTVYIYTDFTVPVDDLRQELYQILKQSAIWDGKVWGLQVTNATERTMELRALMSAANSGKAWDLRCEVREKLITYLQNRYPNSLPRTRAEVTSSRVVELN